MISKALRRNIILYCGSSVLIVLLVLIIGHSIVSEGFKLLFAQWPTHLTNVVSRSDGYNIVSSVQVEYTEINYIITLNNRDITLRGVLAKLNDGYLLILTQQATKDNTHFVISKSFFEQESLNLLRSMVINHIAEKKGLRVENVEQLIHPDVFYDHLPRIVNDVPIVLLWTAILLLGIFNLVIVSKSRLKVLRYKDVIDAHIWGVHKDSFILSTGVLRLGYNPMYMSYDEVLVYESHGKGVNLSTKSHVFKIVCSEQLDTRIKQRIVPDFIVKNKASSS